MTTNNDETDIFQCGKCKAVFSILEEFLSHKSKESLINFQSQNVSDFIKTIPETENAQTNDRYILIINEPPNDKNYFIVNDNEKTIGSVGDLKLKSDQARRAVFMQTKSNVANKTGVHHNLSNDTEKSLKLPVLAEPVGETATIIDKDMNKINCGHYCNFCGALFNKRSNFEQHLRVHMNKKPFECEICGRCFVQKTQLKKHIQTHKVWSETKNKNKFNYTFISDEQIYKCVHCQFLAASYPALRVHMRSHKNLQCFICPNWICKQLFESESDLIEHSKVCKRQSRYRCRKCNIFLDTEDEIKFHLKEHTADEQLKTKKLSENKPRTMIECKNIEKSHKCSVCKATFLTGLLLRQHNKYESHYHQCDNCSKTFVTLVKLRKHQRTHNKLSKNICSICKKKFALSQYLKTHMLSHTDDKQFVCSDCGKKFNRKDNLARHINLHQKTKTLKCPFSDCKKSFYRTDKLKMHVKTHVSSVKGKSRKLKMNKLPMISKNLKVN